jgi:imidazolonepropionase-like amidohydrolase
MLRKNSWLRLFKAAQLLLFVCSGLNAQQADKPIVFQNVDVFDGARVVRNTNVLVHDGLVRAIGRRITVPRSAELIDGKGRTLLPGLIDAHVHLGVFGADQFLRDALNFGVTTELEMWGSDASLALGNRIKSGRIKDLADLRSAGTGITVPRGHPTQMGGPPIPTLGPTDDVQAFVDARIAEGGDYIKIIYDHSFPTFTKQQLERVITAIHRRHKLAVVHIGKQRDARDAVEAGADGLAHIFADTPVEADFVKLATKHHIFVIPTLSVIEAVTESPGKAWWQDSKLAPSISQSMNDMLGRKFPPGIGKDTKLTYAKGAVAALHKAGVTILAGTDAPAPTLAHGLSLHRELELLVVSGLKPLDALTAATLNTSRVFGLHDRGRIAPGKRADLLLVNGDPTVDITATRDVVGVWKLGVRFARYSTQ